MLRAVGQPHVRRNKCQTWGPVRFNIKHKQSLTVVKAGSHFGCFEALEIQFCSGDFFGQF